MNKTRYHESKRGRGKCIERTRGIWNAPLFRRNKARNEEAILEMDTTKQRATETARQDDHSGGPFVRKATRMLEHRVLEVMQDF